MNFSALNQATADSGGSFYEDFLESIELLPNDVRRNFELMKELDRDSGEAIRDCAEAEKTGEKVAIAEQTLELVESRIRKVEADLAHFEAMMRANGEFELNHLEAGVDVAAKASDDDFWVLGRIIAYYLDRDIYEIADVDGGDKFFAPISRIIVLDSIPDKQQKRFSKGDWAPRRSALSFDAAVTVQFDNDENDLGVTPLRVIPIKHVIRRPEEE